MRFTNCISKNPRTYAIYVGASGAVFSNFQIVNPKKNSGAILLGSARTTRTSPWPVAPGWLDIKLFSQSQHPHPVLQREEQPDHDQRIRSSLNAHDSDDKCNTRDQSGVKQSRQRRRLLSRGRSPPNIGEGIIPGTIAFKNYDAEQPSRAPTRRRSPNEAGPPTTRTPSTSRERRHGIPCRRLLPSGQMAPSIRRTLKTAGSATGYLVQGSVGEVGVLLQARRGRSRIRARSQYEHGHLEHVEEGRDPPRLPDGRPARPPRDDAHRVPQPPTASRSLPSGTTPTPTPTPTPVVEHADADTANEPFPGAAIPGHIEAENYNTGGENVAYHDVESTNLGGVYRKTEGVDIEMSSSKGSCVVGWVRPGESLKYSVNITSAGVYDVSFRYRRAGIQRLRSGCRSKRDDDGDCDDGRHDRSVPPVTTAAETMNGTPATP